MERREITDFESINIRLEQLEREPNEPAELFLARASEIVRGSLPDEMRHEGFLPFRDRNPGNLLFAYSATIRSTDQILQKIEETGYFPKGKFIQSENPDIEEWITPAHFFVGGKVNLATNETAMMTFRNTTNSRNFFNLGQKDLHRIQDGMIENTFLLSELHSEIEMEYIRQRLKDKKILLIGGNNSCNDLLNLPLGIQKVVNIDPFTASESMKKNQQGIYESFPLAAEDPQLREKLNNEKFEEIWANFSVPMYSRSPEAIKDSFENMVSLLSVGGTIRIYPVSVGEDYSLPESKRHVSDSMYDALIVTIEELIKRPDLNVFYVPLHQYSAGALFIQKLK